MKRGLDWYQRYPIEYLGGVQGLTAKQHAVYSVTLELIYIHGGSINNDAKWISGYIKDMGSAAVRNTILEMVNRKKLIIEGDQITNFRAENEVKTRQKQSETNSVSGKKGGEIAAKNKAAANENNGLDQAVASELAEAIRRENIRRKESNDKSLLKKTDKPKPKAARKIGRRIPPDWELSKEGMDYAISKGYNREQAIATAENFKNYWLGSTSNATKLDWPATWRVWVCKPHNKPGPNAGRRNPSDGFLEGARRAGAEAAERQRNGRGNL